MKPIKSFTPGWGAGVMAALRLLDEYAEARPDPGYQGGEVAGLLKDKTGITDQELDRIAGHGLVVMSPATFDENAPVDVRWAYAITPRGQDLVARELMHSRLVSIATAQPQSEQAEWMVSMAQEGLRLGESESQT